MKMLVILASAFMSAAALAAPLSPVSSTSRECTAVVTEATYKVDAVCWTNQDNELRMWFPQATFDAIKETGINTRFILNVSEACAQTNQYSYDDLFGTNALPASVVQTRPVDILVSQLDTTACFVK